MQKKTRKTESQAHHKLTERQAKVLAAAVREYCNTAQPVGSEEINSKYRFGISSATIRNELMQLEEMGFLQQPHTSAGRIPTDYGYRYFVKELMKRFELSLKEQQLLRSELLKLQDHHQELGKGIARLLAKETDQAAFALLPDEISASGLSNILSDPNIDKHGVVEVAQFFENIDEYADKMLIDFFNEKPEALIGSEHHMPQISNYSLIVSKIALPDGKKGLIGIIGPKSMRYDKNLSLVDYVSKLLSGGVLLLLLTIKF